MLAYVFWHWPQRNVDEALYVDHLVSFHHTLASNKPEGFNRSTVFRINDVPWLDSTGVAYEEWYLLDDSAAMDKLNDGAVSGACEQPHNQVAREAAGGIGGLYRLRAGQEHLSHSRFAVWLAKPTGVSYPALFTALEPLSSRAGTGLWIRQMTLGPTTEFCLYSADQIQLPTGFDGREVPLELVWTGLKGA